MLKSILGIAFVLTTSRILLAAVCAWQRRCGPPPEMARKLLHIGMGLLILSYPWLFGEIWPVVLLSSIYIGLLVLGALYEPLHYHVASVIYAVDRPSLGEFYFPAAVAVLFILSGGDALLFCIPLLTLTLADAAAAIVGSRWGLHRFGRVKGGKSVEGSAAFFVTAFLIAYLSLVIGSATARPTAAVMSVVVALAGCVLEGLARRGLDNLLVPLGSFVLLRVML